MRTDYYPTGPFISRRPDAGDFDVAREDFLLEFASRNTARAYKTDLQDFWEWCQDQSIEPMVMSPSSLARYLASLSARGYSRGSVGRRLAAIRGFYRQLAKSGRLTVAQAEMLAAIKPPRSPK